MLPDKATLFDKYVVKVITRANSIAYDAKSGTYERRSNQNRNMKPIFDSGEFFDVSRLVNKPGVYTHGLGGKPFYVGKSEHDILTRLSGHQNQVDEAIKQIFGGNQPITNKLKAGAWLTAFIRDQPIEVKRISPNVDEEARFIKELGKEYHLINKSGLPSGYQEERVVHFDRIRERMYAIECLKPLISGEKLPWSARWYR